LDLDDQKSLGEVIDLLDCEHIVKAVPILVYPVVYAVVEDLRIDDAK